MSDVLNRRDLVVRVHTEIPREGGLQRSLCAHCDTDWPCKPLTQAWEATRNYTWCLQDALLTTLRYHYLERMGAHAEELRAKGDREAAGRVLDRAKRAEHDDDAVWYQLQVVKEDLEVPGYGTFRVVEKVSPTQLCGDWSDWSGPRAVVIALIQDGQPTHHFMAVGKNRSHIGEEWDLTRFYEVKGKPVTLTEWSIQ